MRNGKEMNSCLFGEELVAYIYDELPATRRETFGRHLLDCSSCTAELADISLSRLGVYEWHRDEFVPLETPHFVIPYKPKTIAAPQLSWIDALRGFVGSPMRIATAGGALAVIAFAATFGFLFRSAPNNQVAGNVQEIVVPTSQSSESGQKLHDREIVAEQRKDESETSAPDFEFRPAKNIQRTHVVQINAKRPANRPKFQTTNVQTAPRLGNFVETEDKSLRLADLVADIDTRD